MGAYETIPSDQRRFVDKILADTKASNGLAPLDLKAFWADQETSARDPFGPDIPQVPLGAVWSWECIFAELGLEYDSWNFLYGDRNRAMSLSRRYNDLAEEIVGRRILPEKTEDPHLAWPEVKGIEEVFEGKNIWEGGPSGSWWLTQAADNPDELTKLLDRVEKRLEDLRDFILPENWAEEKSRLKSLGQNVPLYRAQRGPCTFACSIYGIENMMFLGFDNPDLMKRFSSLIADVILERARILDGEGGYTAESAPKGWEWYDDNSYLFSPAMYEQFAMPIHRRVFGAYAPGENDKRYQHSDSPMDHLLPQLGELKLTQTNFGPTLSVTQIREACPRAQIDGQLAPFTYSRNEKENIVAEFLRDFEQAREKRGLLFHTAGSVNDGSSLRSLRLIMASIQCYGRYQ